MPGDASEIVAAARDALGGTVDVYCANAGLASAGDAFADEEVWAAAWDVNVMAHVRAARALLPDWLERGSGRFVSTVSAAGLLTMVGAAPYSVTKHGALRLRRVALAHLPPPRPQGARHLPAGRAHGHARPRPDRRASSCSRPPRSSPRTSPTRCSRASRQDRFLILPHPEVAGYYQARAADPDRWLTGMNHIQQKWEGAGRVTVRSTPPSPGSAQLTDGPAGPDHPARDRACTPSAPPSPAPPSTPRSPTSTGG